MIVGAVVVLVGAAVVDSLPPRGSPASQPKRSKSGSVFEARDPVLAPSKTALPLERCTAQQLVLKIERLAGSHLLALAHVWGGPCHTARIPIEVSLFYRKGSPVNPDTAGVSAWSQAFAPTDLSPGVEAIAELHLSYECGERRPRLLVAEARPYVARKWLPRGYIACVDDLGP